MINRRGEIIPKAEGDRQVIYSDYFSGERGRTFDIWFNAALEGGAALVDIASVICRDGGLVGVCSRTDSLNRPWFRDDDHLRKFVAVENAQELFQAIFN